MPKSKCQMKDRAGHLTNPNEPEPKRLFGVGID